MDMTRRPLDGELIISEVEVEMERGLFRLRHLVIAPAEYHIYLHPDDFRTVEGIVPVVIDSIQRSLNERVEVLNAQSWWSRFIRGRQVQIEVPKSGWMINVKPATNGEVAPGEIGIVSRLSLPINPRFESGGGTTRIRRTVVSGTERRTREDETSAGNAEPLAVLRYEDTSGPHEYLMRRDSISLGRGGIAHWVDLTLVGSQRISREHCRIRRGVDGAFLLRDVSQWGTTINGVRVPTADGEGHQSAPGAEAEQALLDGDVIRLADEIRLTFHIPQKA
jgi:hypothetical protein